MSQCPPPATRTERRWCTSERAQRANQCHSARHLRRAPNDDGAPVSERSERTNVTVPATSDAHRTPTVHPETSAASEPMSQCPPPPTRTERRWCTREPETGREGDRGCGRAGTVQSGVHG